jgi:DNA polymerase III subunit gamma/tau
MPNTVVVSVENSVQQDKIRLMKPEIIGFLRRTLLNASIDVRVDLQKNENETKVLTDDQKIKAMIQKNPALGLMKNKFNLDFSG